MSIRDEILAANEAYVASYMSRGALAISPRRKVAILTCMDSRIDVFKCTGLQEGDAHVLRNAGGRATDDAIRSLVISHKLLGTNEWFVIHHTNCGQELYDNATMGGLLEKSLSTAKLTERGWENDSEEGGSPEGHYVNWLTFRGVEDSVRSDVERIRQHPLVNKEIKVHGMYFDVATGRLVPVA